jgi:glycosyltransferase involved in cell wall biosynthesis
MDLYKESDIFILPSLTEGYPQTLFEAMACGVPVIASRVGGIPSIVRDGENGLLVNSTSSEEICEAVRMLIGNPDLARQLAMNGLDTAMRHTMEAERQKIMHHIEDYLFEVKRKGKRRRS